MPVVMGCVHRTHDLKHWFEKRCLWISIPWVLERRFLPIGFYFNFPAKSLSLTLILRCLNQYQWNYD